jgi:hypothetical protein
MPIQNYTTCIDSFKTISEIMQKLAKFGATDTMIHNDDKGNPIAVAFTINFAGNFLNFRLPCNFEGVFNALKKEKIAQKFKTMEQALRVSWRIIKDWVDCQMAIIEAKIASMTEVFLPYLICESGQTLFNECTSTGTFKLSLK